MISTALKLDGEAEFKRELSAVNRELGNVNSEMKLLTAEFKGQANSMDYLTRKGDLLKKDYDQQAEKAKGLADRIKLLEKNNRGATEEADRYRIQLNKTKAAMIDLERELEDNSRYLDEARHSADRAATSIDGFGREIKETDRDMDGFGSTLKGFIGDLGKIKTAIVGGAAVGAVKELASGIMELEESTREYRSIMGTLAVSSEAAGYNADETAKAYGRLQSVLGDPQTAATATANLQAIGLSQQDLIRITDMAIGAWATYGDSIPIDGLAEAINETIQAGKVTGTFADVLNWAGESEDAFNEKLAEAKTKTERANLVLQMMAQQGLADAAQGWFDVNQAIVDANSSEENLRQAWGQLGEVLAPVANFLRDTLAGAVIWLTEVVDKALDGLQKLFDWWNKAKGITQDAGGLKGLFTTETLSKTPAQLEAETQAAKTTIGLTGAELRERGQSSGGAGSDSGTVRHDHTGTIRVEGVNDNGQMQSVMDIMVETLRQEVRR